jgi:hypothetical protein
MAGHYKDSLFRSLFSNEEALRELYNALSGGALGKDTPIVINTLNETLFTARRNDLSFFAGDRLVVLIDHQSTINENMPFRFLEPVFRLFENGITDRNAVYHRKRIRLPWPEFIVLYNGLDPYPEYAEERLSEAFAAGPGRGAPNLELVVRVYNINEGKNGRIAEECRALRGYAAFVGKVRELEKEMRKEYDKEEREEARRRAVAGAVDYCREHGLLKEYWESLTMEEMNMLASEWNLEDAIAVAREEALEEGWEKGRDAIFSLWQQGYSLEEARQMLADDSVSAVMAMTEK